MSGKVISAEDAVRLIRDNASLAVEGSGGGVAEPTLLLKALGARFAAEGAPRGITICHSTGIGDQKEIGLDYLAHEGLVTRDIAGHMGMAKKFAQLILDDKIEAYNFPQGVLSQMYVAVAGRKPGVITKVGLNTYIDPRVEGGRMNGRTKQDLVRILELDGEEWMFWPRFHFDVAFIRGTTADEHGNITCEQEGAFLEGISIAQAAKNCGGIVIAQVKYLAKAGTLNPQMVKIPGIYVDHIVVDPGQKQTTLEEFNPAFSGQVRVPLERIEPIPLDEKKVIARRATKELFKGAVVNLGFGVPSGVAAVAAEEGFLSDFTLTVEQGAVGGMPVGGIIFGMALNPEAIINMDYQFNFYDGGGLDVAFLGMAQTDGHGNVNSSKVGRMLAGCGGFINITQNAKKVVYCGTFTAKGLSCTIGNGKIVIEEEGQVRKFVEKVNQITFSGMYANNVGQPVLYVTERAVFSLSPEGLKLIEIAPGIDLQKDILAHMDFRPLIADDLKTMDPEIFR